MAWGVPPAFLLREALGMPRGVGSISGSQLRQARTAADVSSYSQTSRSSLGVHSASRAPVPTG
jgi:hypothetical protein